MTKLYHFHKNPEARWWSFPYTACTGPAHPDPDEAETDREYCRIIIGCGLIGIAATERGARRLIRRHAKSKYITHHNHPSVGVSFSDPYPHLDRAEEERADDDRPPGG